MKIIHNLACGIIVSWPLILPTSSASAVLIDSFVTAQSAPGGVDTRNTADGSGILGGERDIISYLSLSANGAVPGQLRVAFPNGLLTGQAGAHITYDGNDNNPSSSSYNGLGSVDLTGSSVNDRFRFDITSINRSSANLWIELRSFGKGSSVQLNLPNASGFFDVPFAAFHHDTFFSSPVDFHDIGYINFNFNMSSGESVTIDSITTTTIPEPSTFSLMLGLSLGLFARTSRR